MFQKKTATYKKGFDMKKTFKKILDFILFVFSLDCDTRREAVDEELCDFSGQGDKDKYGR